MSNKRLEPAPSVLYVVGTPIGNLGDLSPRAKSLLKQVSDIACEDTRHSGSLLKSIETKANIFSFHQHNAKSRIPKFIKLLKEGRSLALISDAGLPGISDPGEILVAEAIKEEINVICIPGPSACLTALVSSGLPCDRFSFEGFLPIKTKERKKRLLEIAKEKKTTIIYEAPHRLIRLLEELKEVCGENRLLQVARELTKIHEQQIGKTIGEVLIYFLKNKPLGEFTLVMGGAKEEISSNINNSELISIMQEMIINGATPSEAARAVSKEFSRSRRELYELIHLNLSEIVEQKNNQGQNSKS